MIASARGHVERLELLLEHGLPEPWDAEMAALAATLSTTNTTTCATVTGCAAAAVLADQAGADGTAAAEGVEAERVGKLVIVAPEHIYDRAGTTRARYAYDLQTHQLD